MARQRKRGSRYANSSQIEQVNGADYYAHYKWYLEELAFQLFEWKNLPKSINPTYLEKTLHSHGYVGFYDDPSMEYIAVRGTFTGEINHYDEPTMFQATAQRYNKTFKVFNYTSKPEKNMGVVIFNNARRKSTNFSLNIFATDLAKTRQITNTNIAAQRMPHIFMTDDTTKLSMMNFMNQVEGDGNFILADKNLDLENIKHYPIASPYVADKLNAHRNNIWNEVMTFLGINNANLEKRERMVTSEAESNNDQVKNSGNIFLRTRQEACERINELYGLDVSVDFRVGAIEELKAWAKRDIEGGEMPWQLQQ